MGNALVDVLIKLDDDNPLEELKLPKGSMQLVDAGMAGRIFRALSGYGSVKASGGSAANTIHGLAKLGVPTGFLGKIGTDEWGEFFREDMERESISLALLQGKGESGRALALISPDSERTFATYLGQAAELAVEDIPNNIFDGYSYFHVEGYLVQNRPLISKALEQAKIAGLKVSLDLASYNVVEANLDFLRDLVKRHVDILFANEDEALVFTGGLQGSEAARWMGNSCQTAVLKLGDKGSIICHHGILINVGITKASALDSTGAGDLYAAGFLYGLILKLPIEQCGRVGALLSARVIEVIGPKMDTDRWEEIREEIKCIL